MIAAVAKRVVSMIGLPLLNNVRVPLTASRASPLACREMAQVTQPRAGQTSVLSVSGRVHLHWNSLARLQRLQARLWWGQLYGQI